jgi:hypothetical protein
MPKTATAKAPEPFHYSEKFPDFAERVTECMPATIGGVNQGIAEALCDILWAQPVSFEDMIHVFGECLRDWMTAQCRHRDAHEHQVNIAASELFRLVLQELCGYAAACFYVGEALYLIDPRVVLDVQRPGSEG